MSAAYGWVRRVAAAHDRAPAGAAMPAWRCALLAAGYPRRRRGLWFGVAIELIWPLLLVLARWDWRGGRHVPAAGGALVAVNHLSHLDSIVVTYFVLAQGRVPRFLAMSELWRMRVVGAPVRGGGHIPVDRDAPDGSAYRAAVEAVRAGELVVVYPEGGFPLRSDGWPRPMRSGVARIALETGAPVVPVALWGTQRLFPPGSRVPHLRSRTTLRVLAGAPVELADLHGRPRDTAARAEATDRISCRVRALVGCARGGAG